MHKPFQDRYKSSSSLKLCEDYKLLFQNMDAGFAVHEIICNSNGIPINYKFLDVNTNFEAITGLKAENIIGKTVLDVLPETEDYWIAQYGNVALNKKTITFENYSKALNKYFKVTAFSPEHTIFVTLFLDVTEHIKLVNEIKLSEQNYNAIYNSVSEAVFVQDCQTYEIIEVNSAALSMFGYDTKEEILSKKIGELSSGILSFTEDIAFSHLAESKKNGYHRFEWQAKRKDNSVFWIEFIIKKALFNNCECLLVVGRDITEKKEYEFHLRLSEEKNKSLFQQNEMVILLIDPVSGKLVDANKAASKFYGWTIPELKEMNIFEINTLPREEILGKMSLSINKQKSTYTFKHRTADGSIKDVEVYSVLIRFDDTILLYSMVHDITERRAAEKEVKRLKTHFKSIIDNANDGIVLIDAKGEFNYVSTSAKRIFGYDLNERITFRPDASIHPDDMQLVISEFNHILANSSYTPTLECRFKHKNGHWVWIESSFINMFSNPDVEAAVINFREITERKQTQQRIIESRDILNKLLDEVSFLINSDKLTSGYQKATDLIREISGAKFAIFNEFEKDSIDFTTKSFSGLPDVSEKTKEYFGFNILDFKWKGRAARSEKIGNNTFSYFSSLADLTNDAIPASVTKNIEKAFHLGKVVILSIFKDNVAIGDFTLIFDKNSDIKNKDAIELFAKQFSLYLQRKRIEKSVQLSEEKYKFLFVNNPQPMMIYEVNSLKIIEANESAIQHYGYSLSELTKMTIPDLDVDHNKENKLLSQQNEITQTKIKAKHIKKNGDIICVEIFASQFVYKGKDVTQILINDITDKESTEATLKLKIDELLRFQNLTVGREISMIELKKEINELLKNAGLPEKYKIISE